MPEVSKNTLLSVLMRDTETGRVRVGGQYWDAIIWAIGAWTYFLYTGDREFLDFARPVIFETIAYFEATEWDPEKGLFRGPACYGDGVAAYPDRYFTYGSGILSFTEYAKDRCVPQGVGIPMFALSTNCLYYAAYCIAHRLSGDAQYARKAEALRQSINQAFWDEDRGTYRYLVDPWGGCDAQESMGLSFAILFGVADARMAESIIEHTVITPNGLPDESIRNALKQNCAPSHATRSAKAISQKSIIPKPVSPTAVPRKAATGSLWTGFPRSARPGVQPGISICCCSILRDFPSMRITCPLNRFL